MIGATAIAGDVVVQDIHSNIVESMALYELGSATIASGGLVNTNTVTLEAGHGFVIGNYLAVEGYYVGRVIGVSTNDITVSTRFNLTFPAGTTVLRTTPEMADSGITAPAIFGIRIGG